MSGLFQKLLKTIKGEPLSKGSFFHEKQEEDMWLFVGLGNPGKEYEGNRHNIGFMVVDAIAEEYPSFSGFKSKFQGKMSEGRIAGDKVILLKPETYMNKSGLSVSKAAQFYKVPLDRVIVFHDELDIDAGAVRIKCGGGNAGHNGLKSIQAQSGSPDFWRVRIGIGRPEHKNAVSNYVLSDFAKSEKDWVDDLIQYMAEGSSEIISEDPKSYEALIKDKVGKK
ncbi:MAG: aminoacyl-tRNA hydrolase [Alphaproteobacteria bacterium]